MEEAGGNSNFNHVFLDCEFVNGAAYNDVYWKNTRSRSDYRIKWTLSVKTTPGSIITINDKTGQEVFSGTVSDGQLSLPLIQSIIRPVEWNPEGDEVTVIDRYNYQEFRFTPYTITAEFNGKAKTQPIELNKTSSIEILF